jgi:aspartyl-tRNA(Asn)/glutamyl-tRNA(Gln) amidotransferase subunit A
MTRVSSGSLALLPATQLRDLIAERSVSPVEVVTAVLDRVVAREPEVNAFATLAAESAMEAARAAERSVMVGGPLGPLHGIPVTIKDLAATKGLLTQRGSKAFAGHVPHEDAPFVARLKAAGAIVIGKTTTSEFGWSALSRSPLTGYTHNPWKHGYQAGGSSSGAGAAAGAGYGPLHQGTDAAGSIRVPAHFCGVFGLKPTYGRVPLVPMGNLDYSSHAGPITRTVSDAALMLGVMAGPDPRDHSSLPDDERGFTVARSPLRGLKVAYSPDLGHARVDPEVAGLVEGAAKLFAELGAVVEQVTPAWGSSGPELVRPLWMAHMSILARHLPEFREGMDRGLVACIDEGLSLSARDYMELRERKFAYCGAIGRWFEDWDLLLTPAASVAAFPVERVQPDHWPKHEWDWLQWAEFSYPFNFTGMPAASIPCGKTTGGLPVGLQIVGRRFDEAGVLAAAAAFEKAVPISVAG